jgi:thiamine biosynthesis lipoprotein
MGTRFECVLVQKAPDGSRAGAALRAAGEAALEEIRWWDARLSLFDVASEVSHVNRLAHAAPVPVSPEVFTLVLRCRDLWGETQGRFDPALGAVMAAAGFRDGPMLPAQERRALAARGGLRQVEIDVAKGTLRFHEREVQLDFGAIGKGWALDRARDILIEHGVERAFLHGGTSGAIALGTPPDGTPWTIALAHPDDPTRLLGRLPLDTGQGIAISAPHGRRVQRDGHVLDPTSGSAAHGVLLAAVVDPSATRADAWATALLVCDGEAPKDLACVVMGEDGGLRISGGCPFVPYA